MMQARELLEILEILQATQLPGEVYFKDEDNKLHVIDFLEVDEDGNLVVSGVKSFSDQ